MKAHFIQDRSSHALRLHHFASLLCVHETAQRVQGQTVERQLSQNWRLWASSTLRPIMSSMLPLGARKHSFQCCLLLYSFRRLYVHNPWMGKWQTGRLKSKTSSSSRNPPNLRQRLDSLSERALEIRWYSCVTDCNAEQEQRGYKV